MFRFYVILLLLQESAFVFARSESFLGLTTSPSFSSPPKVILLDVDNTLYQESELVARGMGIESQIVQRVHNFFFSRCNLTASEADRLHREYGSSIEGIRQTSWKNLTAQELVDKMRDFYESVYKDIDVSQLLSLRSKKQSTSTGYTHEDNKDSGASAMGVLRDILTSSSASSSPQVYFGIASNSPKQHVEKILHVLGLRNAPGLEIFTPDCLHYSPDSSECFPTKARPLSFFRALLSQFKAEDICLIDDSSVVLEAVESQAKIRGFHVSKDQTLVRALGLAMGWLDPSFHFSDANYLQSKNIVDLASIHKGTWGKFLGQLGALVKTKTRAEPLVMVDLGAGLLSMLQLLLKGAQGVGYHSLKKVFMDDAEAESKVDRIVYYAYEPNWNLESSCKERLESLGFECDEDNEVSWTSNDVHRKELKELIFFRQEDEHLPYVEARLRFWDFRVPVERAASPSPDVILGCCFADLIEPTNLVLSTMQQFLASPQRDQSHALLYFPITFCGTTQFMPPQQAGNLAPSDSFAFRLYSDALQSGLGHNLDPGRLVEEVKTFGGELLSRGKSDWEISPDANDYLWKSMLHFFGTTAAPAIHKAGFNAHAWLQGARKNKPNIRASNEDILFRIPFVGVVPQVKHESDVLRSFAKEEEILFTAPHKVTTKRKQRAQLKKNEVRIASVCSLVSTGTELKIFKGMFEDAALDANIKEMQDQRMKYPLAYGYSLVGHVVECGSGVHDKDTLMGKLVFAFAPHSTRPIVDRSALQRIPDGIEPYDAIFMPSVETALSIVHDAHLRFGEKVGVFGQGLIGLLVTAILSQTPGCVSRLASLTTFDAVPSRLAASVTVGASEALLPHQASESFDVTIEVSGNHKALQAAIDHTKNNGRVVIASWYGSNIIELKLGIDFHRSHKTLITSQVSELPPEIRGTWTKARRFALAWELVRLVRPSRLLTRTAPLSDAQNVYTALDRGDELAVAFDLRSYPKEN